MISNLNGKVRKLAVLLEPDEQPLEIIPKHWGYIIGSVATAAFLILISLAIFFLLAALNNPLEPNFLIGFVVMSSWSLLLAVFCLSQWYSYQTSALILTNQRLINLNQINFFSRRIYDIRLETIRTASNRPEKPLGDIFGYGVVILHLADDSTVAIYHIPHPSGVAETILSSINAIS